MKLFSKNSGHDLKLVMFESAITSGLISMPIMTPFFYSIGLSNVEITLSQVIFTIVIICLNLPMGWLADRLSRKWANIIGDFGYACECLLYATAHSFGGVVFCECWLGVFLSLSQGVDFSLLKHFSNQLDPSGDVFRQKSAELALWQHACSMLLVLLGGPIGAVNFRLAIALSGVPHLLGGAVSILIRDDSKKLQQKRINPLKDMAFIVASALRQSRLRWRLLAYAIGREMTHGIIWILTPMLLVAGIPLPIVSVAWVLDNLARITGAHLASRYAFKLKNWQIFAVPLILMTISMSVLATGINIYTVSFYLLMGIVCGWTSATLMPLVQEEVAPTEQTTVISLARIMGQFIYIPSALLIGWAADFHLSYAALATVMIFLPLGLAVLTKFRAE